MVEVIPCPGCGIRPGFRHYRGCPKSGGPFDDKPYEPEEEPNG